MFAGSEARAFYRQQKRKPREPAQRHPPGEYSGEAYLEMADKSGAPLRAVWQLTQRWAEDGDLAAGHRLASPFNSGTAGDGPCLPISES